MAKIDMDLIQQLRTRTGVGMMDCRKALEEAGGNLEEAIGIETRFVFIKHGLRPIFFEENLLPL